MTWKQLIQAINKLPEDKKNEQVKILDENWNFHRADFEIKPFDKIDPVISIS